QLFVTARCDPSKLRRPSSVAGRFLSPIASTCRPWRSLTVHPAFHSVPNLLSLAAVESLSLSSRQKHPPCAPDRMTTLRDMSAPVQFVPFDRRAYTFYSPGESDSEYITAWK